MNGAVLDEYADAIDTFAKEQYLGLVSSSGPVGNKSHKTPYLANQSNMLAFDNCLRSCTSLRGLVDWVNELPIKPMQRAEARFKVQPDDLPDELRATLYGRRFRSGIVSHTTGDTRLEVCYDSCKKSLWNYLDTALVGFNGRLICFYFFGVVGTEAPDFTHRRVRTAENALSQSQLSFAKKEYEIVLSYLDGPFHSHANYQEFVALFKEMRKTYTWKNAFFLSVYAWYVFIKHKGKVPKGFGTQEHMALTWDDMAFSKLLETISVHYSRGRWYAFNDKFRLSREDHPILFMVLMYKAVVKDQAPDPKSLPLFGGVSRLALAPAAPAAPAAGAAAGAADVPVVPIPEVVAVKHSNESLEALRRKIPGAAQFTLHVLSNMTTGRIVNATTIFGLPREEDTKLKLTRVGTQSGRKEFHIQLACGVTDSVIKDTLKLLRDRAVLQELGFPGSGACLGTNTPAEDKHVAFQAHAVFEPRRHEQAEVHGIAQGAVGRLGAGRGLCSS